MLITNKKTCEPFVGKSSEKIYELLGIRIGDLHDVSLAYLELLPNTKTPKHFHPNMTEIYYVLQGKADLFINDKVFAIQKDDAILVEKMAAHYLYNNSSEPLFLLTISTPAWTATEEISID